MKDPNEKDAHVAEQVEALKELREVQAELKGEKANPNALKKGNACPVGLQGVSP